MMTPHVVGDGFATIGTVMKDERKPIPVLLVEGSPAFRRILTRLLEQSPDVTIAGVASKGEEIFATAGEIQPRIVLFDMASSGTGGIGTLRRLRQLLPHAHIIAMAVFDVDSYRQEALAAGADACIAKVDLEVALLPAIQQVTQSLASQVEDSGLYDKKCVIL